MTLSTWPRPDLSKGIERPLIFTNPRKPRYSWNEELIKAISTVWGDAAKVLPPRRGLRVDERFNDLIWPSDWMLEEIDKHPEHAPVFMPEVPAQREDLLDKYSMTSWLNEMLGANPQSKQGFERSQSAVVRRVLLLPIVDKRSAGAFDRLGGRYRNGPTRIRENLIQRDVPHIWGMLHEAEARIQEMLMALRDGDINKLYAE